MHYIDASSQSLLLTYSLRRNMIASAQSHCVISRVRSPVSIFESSRLHWPIMLVWRTSTAEPTKTGIIWTALKDVSRYMPLFAESGILILDLNNIIDSSLGLNGEFDVTLSATFYESSLLHPAAKKSDLIIPLSNMSPDQANYFSVPPSYSVRLLRQHDTI